MLLLTRGAGRLTLSDGVSLAGLVVAEGIDILPGARVYVEGETVILSSGENRLLGTFVHVSPGAGAAFEGEVVELDDGGPTVDLENPDAAMLASGGPPPGGFCPSVVQGSGANGVKPA
ncbi:MAG: hypothetical protein FJ253_05830, partial [Phycisphaerae bacterium]|nr:hypothetical protein [Phycisphaerae bacterium]